MASHSIGRITTSEKKVCQLCCCHLHNIFFRVTETKRSRSWKNVPKKLKFDSPPLKLPATNYKSLPSFQAFIEQTVFYYANNKIKVKVTVVDSIPVRRQSSCSRCYQARSKTNFVGLLQSIQWKDLLHHDPPFTILIQIKHLATVMRQLVIEKTDNSSSKEFTAVLLGLMKILTPKVVDE
uniref:Uncharacterized protein n=1 Tax=Amphimedon queenslandica TaxID=400682 RepID=A0A1X7UP09_AMPQE